jgi:hypothetical protein
VAHAGRVKVNGPVHARKSGDPKPVATQINTAEISAAAEKTFITPTSRKVPAMSAITYGPENRSKNQQESESSPNRDSDPGKQACRCNSYSLDSEKYNNNPFRCLMAVIAALPVIILLVLAMVFLNTSALLAGSTVLLAVNIALVLIILVVMLALSERCN